MDLGCQIPGGSRISLMNEKSEAEAPDEWVRVGHYDSLQQAYDHGLVVLAMG